MEITLLDILGTNDTKPIGTNSLVPSRSFPNTNQGPKLGFSISQIFSIEFWLHDTPIISAKSSYILSLDFNMSFMIEGLVYKSCK